MPIKIFKKGEEISLEKAIEESYKDALSHAINHIKDEDLAADIFHDVLEGIVIKSKAKYNTFESVGKFTGFLKTSINNKFLDKLRKEKRSPIGRYEPETFELILNYSASDYKTDKYFDDEYDELLKKINKVKFLSARSYMDPIQYLVTTLRMNDYPFNKIVEITGSGLNTVLGQMRYGKIAIEKRFNEKRVREKRRRRFKEGRDGTADLENVLLKLPPYQYFVVKMKQGKITFKEIGKLEGVCESTMYYRWKWAKKNLKKIAESEEDYESICKYLDSNNKNVGGKNWHKKI